MANSTRQKIADHIITTVAALTTAGGYNFDWGEVQRGFKHFDNVPSDKFPAAYLAGIDEARENSTQREFQSDFSGSLVIYVKTANARDTEQLERDLDNVIEDVTKALMVDVTRGGVAITTELGEIDTDKGAFAPYASAEITVNCDYRAPVSAP